MANKPRFQWFEYNIDASTGNTGIVGYPLIAGTVVEDTEQATVYRVICKFRPVNGATINNTVKAGIIVQKSTNAALPTSAPMTQDGISGYDWMTTGNASHPSASGAMVEIEMDTTSRRVLHTGDALYLMVDDVQGDWDMIGGGARILLRID